jgi:isoleucyl-tRNA synthetase
VPVVPVDARGRFTAPVDDYAGVHVFDANLMIVDHLRARLRLDRSSDSAVEDAGATTPGTVLVQYESYPQLLPALLAMPEPADLPGRLQLVR